MPHVHDGEWWAGIEEVFTEDELAPFWTAWFADRSNYREAEQTVLVPLILNRGWESGLWKDGERDSFGPLTRRCWVDHPGYPGGLNLVYG